ncbi:MAG: DNA helicase RecQ, partial [Verrucomicrobiota bacterium]
MTKTTEADTEGALEEVFGFSGFREHQGEIVEAVLAKRDVFAVMPTGGGKSLCYQLPARLMEGTCVVVSPLISLMKDQVDAARANGLKAAYVNSSQEAEERAAALRALYAGELELLYLAPERLAVGDFLESLGEAQVSFFAIDEAHCISEWGHDFRPDYLVLSNLVKVFPDVPVAAFTATATARVADDIREKLGLRDPFEVRASFNRPNLFYQVELKEKLNDQLYGFLRDREGQSGIIYRTTRKSVEETAAFLTRKGIKALPYHAGLEPEVRAANQEAFNRDEVPVVVATIAFGMGIDKPNVRFVVHGDLPKNMEGYYQETGRAGRDGDKSHCQLYFSRGDVAKMMYFIRDIEDARERETAERLLWEMVRFAEVHVCRRRKLLEYFGESYPEENCGACDVCTGDVETVDATRDAQIVMSAMLRTGQRFGAVHVIDVVTGADTARVRQFGHEEVKTYGAGADRPKKYWRYVIDNLLAQEALCQVGDPYPHLEVTGKGEGILRGGASFEVLRQKEAKGRARAASRGGGGGSKGEELDYDRGLFKELKALRKAIADEENVPPYVVFGDRALREMAAYLPETSGAFLEINGVGQTKLDRYGERFLGGIGKWEGGRSDGG